MCRAAPVRVPHLRCPLICHLIGLLTDAWVGVECLCTNSILNNPLNTLISTPTSNHYKALPTTFQSLQEFSVQRFSLILSFVLHQRLDSRTGPFTGFGSEPLIVLKLGWLWGQKVREKKNTRLGFLSNLLSFCFNFSVRPVLFEGLKGKFKRVCFRILRMVSVTVFSFPVSLPWIR